MVFIKCTRFEISFLLSCHVRVVMCSFMLLLLLSGCATWGDHGVTVSRGEKFRIAILPLKVTAEVDKASDIMTPPTSVVDEGKLIRKQMRDVAVQLSGLVNSKLLESSYIDPVPLESHEIVSSMPATDTAHVLNLDALQALKVTQNVQAVLMVTLSGYGKIKKKWLTYLIGSGVVEGVTQGFVAAKLVKNPWVGVVVMLEEIGQELLVWGGGAYLFDRHYAPVTLEAQLISTTDGQEIWSDTVFVSVDKDAIELLPEKDQKRKELQLSLTAKKAINELVQDINDKAKSNLNISTSTSEEEDDDF